MPFSKHNQSKGIVAREHIYHAMVEMATDAIVLIDAVSLCFVEINQAACRLLDYSRDELIGQPILLIDVIQDESDHRELTETLMEKGAACLDKQVLRKDGQRVDVRIHSQVLNVADKTYVISIWRDTGESLRQKKALQDSEGKFRYFIEHNTAVMMLIDPETGLIEEANRAAVSFYGYSYDRLVGMNIDQINSLPQEQINVLRQQAINATSGMSFSVPHRLISGEIRHVEVNVTPLEYQGRRLLFSVIYDITDRHQAIQALQESERAFRRLFDDAVNPIVLFDPESGKIIDCNQATVRFLQYSRKSEIIGQTPRMFIPALKPDGTPALPNVYSSIGRAIDKGSAFFDCQPVTRDGQRLYVEISLTALSYRGKPVIHALWTDISARKQAEKQLRLTASVFTNANEAISICEPDGTIVDVNAAFTRITGFGREEVIGKNPRILYSGKHDKVFYHNLWLTLQKTGQWQGEIWNKDKNGDLFACLLNISTVYDGQGNTQHFVSLMTDITPFKEQQEQLEYLAHYDVLTRLPNRVLLHDRLHQSMKQVQRNEQFLAVVYLDLDCFKEINDRHGHEAGDQLLVRVTENMLETLRDSDTLARIGGDEFVVILPDLIDTAACQELLHRLLQAVSMPVSQNDDTLAVSASLGVSFFPQADSLINPDQLLRQADQAMYQAKLAGKNKYHIFDPEHDRHQRIKHEGQQHFRKAFANDEFVLFYQPKVNMMTGEVIGAEALIRWQHPEKGILPPSVFLPAIEDHPLSINLGEWVIETALYQMQSWLRKGIKLPVSVNIGARQLQQENFPVILERLIADYPEISPEDLTLEILESSALEDIALVTRIIEACHKVGVQFSLDDFGTGYSSLTYLKRLQVNQLKIDQSFVRNVLHDIDDRAILQGVVGMAAALQREVIAEGVETEEHGIHLLQLGCVLAQGYGIARPMPASQVLGWMESWQPYGSWVSG